MDRPAHSNPAVSKAASEAVRQLTSTAPMTLLEGAVGLIVAQDRSLHTAALAAVDLVLPPPSQSQARPAEWDAFCVPAERKAWLQDQLASLTSSEMLSHALSSSCAVMRSKCAATKGGGSGGLHAVALCIQKKGCSWLGSPIFGHPPAVCSLPCIFAAPETLGSL